MILAVDGGNSKTDVALVAADGRLLAAVRGPTTSHQQVGLEPGIERLAGLVAELRSGPGWPPTRPPLEVGAFGAGGRRYARATSGGSTDALVARGLAVTMASSSTTPSRRSGPAPIAAGAWP